MQLSASLVKASVKNALNGLSLHYQHAYVHPCVINNKPCVVYPAGLKQNSPQFYQKLNNYFSAKGYLLKEDQRVNDGTHPRNKERRRWMPILLFTAAMLSHSDVQAKDDYALLSENIKQQVELKLIPDEPTKSLVDKLIVKPVQLPEVQSLKSHTASLLFAILEDHYLKQPADPEYIIADLKQMANYYSQFPKVISLLTSLKQQEWVLRYDENIWSTVASGNAIQVDNATIHFNTRSAAKLKLQNSCNDNPVCIASPADALLHELLHTHSMLLNTDEFIKQGGMNRFRYPFKHEYSIIQLEKSLYASMSKQDGIKRPQRNEHTGRKIIASCVTCIK